MKDRPVLLGATLALILVGLTFALLGWLLPGRPPSWEPGVASGKSLLSESRKKLDTLPKAAVPPAESKPNPHRVFVSRALVFLPKEEEAVQAMNPEMVTEDKIQVGWKLRHGFDPEDPEVASRDDDMDGFSNLEEFIKDTNPRDPQKSPSKWVKLRLASFRPVQMDVSLAAMGLVENRYTLRFSVGNRRKDIDVVLGEEIWIGVGEFGPEVWKDRGQAQNWSKRRGNSHLIPIKILEFKKDLGQRLDPRTQTMNDYNDSSIVLERADGMQEKVSILIDERGKSRGVSWNVGEVTLFSMVPGEGDLGPYRVGQTFAYADREFLVRDAATSKVSLELLPEREKIDILPKTP